MKLRSFLISTLLAGSFAFTVSAQDAVIPDYSSTPRDQVPNEFKWNLSDIYSNYELWNADKAEVNTLLGKIKDQAKSWTSSAKNMLAMFKTSDKLELKLYHLYSYARRQYDMEMSNSTFNQMKGEIQSIYVDASMQLNFMNDDLLKMDEKTLMGYFSEEPNLAPYKFTVEQLLRSKKHMLPLAEEQLLSLTGIYSSNISEAASILNDVDIPAPTVTLTDGSKVELNYANYYKYRTAKSPEDRAIAVRGYWKNHKQYENTLATLFDGGMKMDLFNAKARKFNSCLQARLFQDNIDTTVYYQLIKEVNANLPSLHKYLKLKQKMLGLETLKYEDLWASSVKSVNKVYPYDEAKKLVQNSLVVLGSEYADGLKQAFNNGWIDVYPNKDKESGAYSDAIYDIHPYVKMNYDGEYSNVSTLAHELGHAMHSYLTNRNQPYSNSNYTTFLAEIASTFNENLLMDYLLKNETDDNLKLFIIDQFLERARQTIYRQALFAEFELAMHQKVEEGKTLTADWLNQKYLELTRLYYGHDKGVTLVDDYIEIEWSKIPHFFYNFYVFQYSTGIISSMALSQNIITGKTGAVDKYLGMLKSGNSDYSIKLLQNAGVDMMTSDPYDAAFKRFDDLVAEMEKIYERVSKK
ncbi:MAG: oligoendopeptidase F [Ignavibacteriales bacterium]|jgi:oligoendopeptidase F|nr:oligoendopeptidase F [Ignavibacteriales bacterium]MBP9121799.1 oligoendopeptidase F [Ignavibacteriaceae bacterium]MCC6637112.1 oligoendopeptidase F [Ignavibacteriaceae bacterium]